MFRLFLRSKLFDAGSAEDAGPRLRNRRIFERFPIDHKHLALMNEQDILMIRELSAKGFSTVVSTRTWERLTIGDVYEGRMRHVGEVYDLEAKVSWKEESASVIGFEIMRAPRATLDFLKRLLRPVEIARSLRKVEASFTNDSTDGKVWYHGDEESDLYVWYDETGRVNAWQLAVGRDVVEWTSTDGLHTGAMMVDETEPFTPALRGSALVKDPRPDRRRLTLASDILVAMDAPIRDELLNSITG